MLFYQIALLFRPSLLPMLWAVILAYMTFLLHVRLHARPRAWRWMFWPFVVVPMLLMVVMLAQEAADAELAVQA